MYTICHYIHNTLLQMRGKKVILQLKYFCMDRCSVLLLQQVGIKDKGYETCRTAPINFPRKCSII